MDARELSPAQRRETAAAIDRLVEAAKRSRRESPPSGELPGVSDKLQAVIEFAELTPRLAGGLFAIRFSGVL